MTTATTFGKDIRPQVKEYRKAVQAARDAYDKIVDAYNRRLGKARSAIHNALGTDQMAFALVETVAARAEEKFKPLRDEAAQRRAKTIREAKAQLLDAVSDDPFSLYLVEEWVDRYSDSFLDLFFESAPHTLDSVRELAEREQWCADYEDIMMGAMRKGIVPADTVEVVLPVNWSDVPWEHAPKPKEQWECKLQLYRFARFKWNGVPVSPRTLEVWAESAVYFKVADAPA